MKNRVWICLVLLIILSQLYSCKKDSEKSLSVLTTNLSKITQSTATCVGNISSNGGATITEKGFCWSTKQNPTVVDNKAIVKSDSANFIDTISGLSSNIKYFIRSYAINSKGIAYGNEQSFTLWINTPGPNVTDVDGNNYTSVIIGTQVWMKENLKVTKYNDSTSIPMTPDPRGFTDIITPYYGWYDKDSAKYKKIYGALYNWATVDYGKLCPIGWHVPTSSEWETLVDYLGGINVAGGKLKESDTAHWINPNIGATNETGFIAIPGGYYWEFHASGSFHYESSQLGYRGYWWSSSEYDADNAILVSLYNNESKVIIENNDKWGGFSVRCIMDSK